MKKIITTIILLTLLLITSISHANLVDNRDGTISDTDSGLMWMQDANYARAAMSWSQSVDWADRLVFARYDDWRLPSALNEDGTGPCEGYCYGSEIGHLYFTELRNPAKGPASNFGPFINLNANLWTGTEFSGSPTKMAWQYVFSKGAQVQSDKGTLLSALAVRSIAPPAAPEPVSYILFVTGGALLAGRGYLRKKRT